MLSRGEIARSIECITSKLDGMKKGGEEMSACAEISILFTALREQYRRQPESLAGWVEELAQLRRRFEDLLQDHVASVIDRFDAVTDQIRRAQQEREFWRGFLIRKATQDQVQQLDGATSAVRVRSVESRLIPPAGASERQQMEDLIRNAGCWEHVSQLSRTRLEKALAEGVLPKSQSQEVERLCPVTTRYQVMTVSRTS